MKPCGFGGVSREAWGCWGSPPRLCPATRKAWLALSLMAASSGLSTGVWRVKRVSNWLTSSSDCCGEHGGCSHGAPKTFPACPLRSPIPGRV